MFQTTHRKKIIKKTNQLVYFNENLIVKNKGYYRHDRYN